MIGGNKLDEYKDDGYRLNPMPVDYAKRGRINWPKVFVWSVCMGVSVAFWVGCLLCLMELSQ